MAKPLPTDLRTQRDNLRRRRTTAYQEYYRSEVFGGPSLYFHEQALSAAGRGNLGDFLTHSYAVLTAWGMHRMGRGGAKMCEFELFRASVERAWPRITALQQAAGPADLDPTGWEDLRSVFCEVNCMATGTSLVGNSKVLAHALPRLVPPVDREYTLRFVFGRTDIANDRQLEWKTLELLLREFFYPLLADPELSPELVALTTAVNRKRWDTSPLKVLDNLVIGAVRLAKQTPSFAV